MPLELAEIGVIALIGLVFVFGIAAAPLAHSRAPAAPEPAGMQAVPTGAGLAAPAPNATVGPADCQPHHAPSQC